MPRSDRSRGGRPPYDQVLMFRVLILQSSHSLSDERTEYLIKDRLSFMRFLGLSLAQSVPDANSIWNFREALTRAKIDGKPAIEVLFKRFDAALTKAGFLAMGGQIIDATIVGTPKQRNTEAEKKDIKEGRIPEDWTRKPAKLRQKDRDARWTVKYSKAKPSEDGAKRVDLAIPAFGYKNHIGIDRAHGLFPTTLSTLTLLIIRHAEKRGEQWLGPGSNESGQPDGKSLVIRGWERAGAWAALFGSDLGGNDYPKPGAIFAANPGAGGTPDEGPSRRPYETVSVLSARLSLSANVAYALGQEEQLVTTLVGLSGVALVCWEHKAIAAQIVPSSG